MPAIRRIKNVFGDVNIPSDLLHKVIAHGRATNRFNDLTESGARPYAEINCGRWIVRCPNCGNAMLADPDWPTTSCIECGRVYTPCYPAADDVLLIEATLVRRPEVNQNWLPTETLDDLYRENLENGLGSD